MHPDAIIVRRFFKYARTWQPPRWKNSQPQRWREDQECWPWPGYRDAHGYGKVGWFGQQIGVHVIAYEFTYGPLPAGRMVCHLCDYPPCCNPRHLYAGTSADNQRDRRERGLGSRTPIHYLHPDDMWERRRWREMLEKLKRRTRKESAA